MGAFALPGGEEGHDGVRSPTRAGTVPGGRLSWRSGDDTGAARRKARLRLSLWRAEFPATGGGVGKVAGTGWPAGRGRTPAVGDQGPPAALASMLGRARSHQRARP